VRGGAGQSIHSSALARAGETRSATYGDPTRLHAYRKSTPDPDFAGRSDGHGGDSCPAGHLAPLVGAQYQRPDLPGGLGCLDAALVSDSPLAKVQGTINGTASVDGQQYRALDVAKVAHTFTIPQLGLNVPIPGDASNDANYLTVTFSFRTGGAGTYTFQCFAPCGTGNGFDGPMASMAYMKGTLTVQG
jgi:hypothetical protein